MAVSVVQLGTDGTRQLAVELSFLSRYVLYQDIAITSYQSVLPLLSNDAVLVAVRVEQEGQLRYPSLDCVLSNAATLCLHGPKANFQWPSNR